ncbi:hypothetical protein FN846DRAFT_959402 [Sphaerosporella brunnea]|uniref:EamA domain-containing protein n=1 Tax=Sphaerosporella brunnea TaxID=1250544 RepID=A0A5J5EPT9_9PEZI|nr:hypothetical protein FN846DRAFT_959402 [Sphaerosporella brunnea]
MATLRTREDGGSAASPLLETGAGSRRRQRRWTPLVPAGAATRRNFGMALLGVVVFLWVSSNFLTHAIFADDSYSKPYFLTYMNTSIFSLYLVPSGVRWYLRRRRGGQEEAEEDTTKPAEDKLDNKETMRLSLEFCLIWFFANYFNSYCLKFTSVASATILSSTSSMFTLIIGSLLRTERFTATKLLSVLVSLLGIVLISTTDLSPSGSSSSDAPVERTPIQVLTGDAMALLSALAYSTYITLLKVRAGNESRVDMQLFFGFVGLFNLVFLWPGLWILHATGVERFEMPPEGRVWAILAVNASITLTSDYCWAYAMLLTTPLIVTVGLSLTIPLALMGQMVILGTVAGVRYWLGAACVFVAFWFLNREEERTG